MSRSQPTNSGAPRTEPASLYQERARRFAERRDREGRRGQRIASARISAFLGALALLFWAEVDGGVPDAPLAGLAAVLLAGFVALIVAHRRVRRRRERYDALRRLNERALHRLDRSWDRLPEPSAPDEAADHPFAADLDLFGPASVSQLLGTERTAAGQHTLDRWLLEPAAADAVPARQRAVADLASRIDLRDALAAEAWLGADATIGEIEAFLAWTEGRPRLLDRPGVLWASRLLPAAAILLAGLRIAGVTTGHWWLIPFAAGLVLSRRWADAIDESFDRAFARPAAFEVYPALFDRIEDARFDAPLLRGIRAELAGARPRGGAPDAAGGPPSDEAAADAGSAGEGGGSAARAVRRLARIGVLADTRHSSFHGVIHAVTLWDFHVLWLLERWQRGTGGRARRWFDALARTEALAGLAALAHAEPEWTFPEVGEHEPARLEATSLGHPLLPGESRVANDVAVGPPGTVLFVTGSNMSGKSTLLRAIGVNAVLAHAGAPVCCRHMSTPPLVIRTSIRVDDSLAEGVSFFMAELQRLKRVVEAADEAGGTHGRTLLYLLDEMLQGTNTRERRIAARRIAEHLLGRPAIGAITSHDLRLLDSTRLDEARRDVHFAETIRREAGRPLISFDYELRPGIATTTNALALMEAIGLEVGAEGETA